MNKATKKPITRRTGEEKLGLIQEWEKSGLFITSFSRQHGFADSQFYSCLKVYRPKNQLPSESEFIPLPITTAPALTQNTASLYAEPVLTGGASIKLYQPVTGYLFAHPYFLMICLLTAMPKGIFIYRLPADLRKGPLYPVCAHLLTSYQAIYTR